MTSLQVFKTQSVEPDALIAPFFQLALKFYKDMNMAVARWTANQGGRLIRKFRALTVDSLPPVDMTKILKILQRSHTKTTPSNWLSPFERRILMVAIYGSFTARLLHATAIHPSDRGIPR